MYACVHILESRAMKHESYLVVAGPARFEANPSDVAGLVSRSLDRGVPLADIAVYQKVNFRLSIGIEGAGTHPQIVQPRELRASAGRPVGTKRQRTADLKDRMVAALKSLGGMAQLADITDKLMAQKAARSRSRRSVYNSICQAVRRYPEFKAGKARGAVQLADGAANG